ncbi:MAG: MATE family efflux transporter [Lachnospiraceae bacterium]|nr:MATE family efflux transporter [Lachnospiraceae bacterium]MDD3796928.1 MATE family efflux transporter [Lachnospiraceae bacterium]
MTGIKDMTEGSPLRLIVSFSLPLLAGNILQQLYNMVDTIVVGKGISVDALAAVGATGSIYFLILGFVTGLTQGVSILAAQYYGSKNMKEMRQSVTMSAYLCFGLGLIITILSVICTRDLLLLLNTPEAILEDAIIYIRIIFMASLITVAYNFFSGILRALGDSRNPLIAMIISFLVNVVLDILFVITFQMGVAGAAYATIMAQAVSAVYCYLCIRKIDILSLHKEDWKFNRNIFQKSFRLSLPVALMNSVTAVGVMVLQAVVNGFGAVYIAAYSAASKLVIILEQISSTFGFGVATFVGQNIGARRVDRIKEGVKKSVIFLSAVNLVVGVIMALVGKSLFGLIVSREEVEVVNAANIYLTVCSLSLIFLGLLFIYRCAAQALGDTIVPMFSGVVEFVMRIVCALLLPLYFGFAGAALAEVGAWIGACIILYINFRRLMKGYDSGRK